MILNAKWLWSRLEKWFLAQSGFEVGLNVDFECKVALKCAWALEHQSGFEVGLGGDFERQSGFEVGLSGDFERHFGFEAGFEDRDFQRRVALK